MAVLWRAGGKGVMSTEPRLRHALDTAWCLVHTQFLFQIVIWALSAQSFQFLVLLFFFLMSYKTSSGMGLAENSTCKREESSLS